MAFRIPSIFEGIYLVLSQRLLCLQSHLPPDWSDLGNVYVLNVGKSTYTHDCECIKFQVYHTHNYITNMILDDEKKT